MNIFIVISWVEVIKNEFSKHIVWSLKWQPFSLVFRGGPGLKCLVCNGLTDTRPNQSSVGARILTPYSMCKTDFCFEPRKYFLSANNTGSSSTKWKTNPRLEITLSGYNSTETVSCLLRNHRKALTLLQWSHQPFIHVFQRLTTGRFSKRVWKPLYFKCAKPWCMEHVSIKSAIN